MTEAVVVPRRSTWAVRSFTVWGGGERLWRGEALRTAGQLLLWLGEGGDGAMHTLAAGVGGNASALLGGESAAGCENLARRLAAALQRPVFVCGAPVKRRALPPLERALLLELRALLAAD